MPSLRFLVPANVRHNSGGNVYNARLAQGLRELGIDVDVLPVDGSWPEASGEELRRLGSLLGMAELPAAPRAGLVTIVDGLIASGAPDELEGAAARRLQAWVLMHMPSAGSSEREERALRAAAGVICTSSSAAARISSNYRLPAGPVALPGTDPAPTAKGSDPPHIIAVAALLPNKDQLLIVEALGLLRHLPWTASLVGSEAADAGYAGLVRGAIIERGLSQRIRMTGQLTGQDLEDEWDRADLSLLVSRAEAFGLVVTESLARGIPVIVREGTGAVEALTFASGITSGRHRGPARRPAPEAALPGAVVGLSPAGFLPSEGLHPGSGPSQGGLLPGHDAARAMLLADAIQRWLEDQRLRARWREAALGARARLPGWDHTARAVLDILESES